MDTFALQFLQPGNRTPLRIAAYIRISGEEERKDNGSFHTQQQFFTSLIQSCPDWKLAGIYGDYAKTGTQIAGRHAFQQMLRDAARGKMDYILTKSVSRFVRNNGLVVQFYIYDHHPALISRALYQQVSRLLHNKQLFGQRHFSPGVLQIAQAAADRDPLLDDSRRLLQQFCFTL